MPLDASFSSSQIGQALDRYLAAVELRAFRFSELSLGNRDDALECVQESMMAFVRYKQRPEEEWDKIFWTILRRKISSQRRANRWRTRIYSWIGKDGEDSTEIVDTLASAEPDPAQAHQRQNEWLALRRAMNSLPARQQEAFLLRTLQGMSTAQTAEVMGCSQGSVKTHLFRATEQLKNQLEEWQ